jgi:hypothetical protein
MPRNVVGYHKRASEASAFKRGECHLTAFQQPLPGIQEVDMLRRSMASMAGHVRRIHEEGAAYRYALTDAPISTFLLMSLLIPLQKPDEIAQEIGNLAVRTPAIRRVQDSIYFFYN